MTCNSADEWFVRHLRQALRHLYDPPGLRANPLFELLGPDRVKSAAALRRVLIDAIEALKPSAGVSPQSDAWRTYRTLVHRYIEQFSQSEVASNFGMSIRQFRRQERLALRTLADYLRSQYDLRRPLPDHGETPVKGSAEDASGDTSAVGREGELQWLEKSLPSEPTDLREMILAVLETIGPLVEASGVQVECRLSEGLPRPVIRRTVMRQALLTTLTAAIRSIPGGQVSIEDEAHSQRTSIYIRPVRSQSAVTGPQPWTRSEDLEMACRLAALSGGSLELLTDRDGRCPFTARLVLPAAEQMVVLVIDDNADALQLFQRYLAGSRYSFAGTRDPQQALALAEKLTPQIVVLDVMLPEIDGWELLGRLREHPRTRGIPVIVCTILPQEQLALTLGAAAFLRKPFTRAELLSVLDDWADL